MASVDAVEGPNDASKAVLAAEGHPGQTRSRRWTPPSMFFAWIGGLLLVLAAVGVLLRLAALRVPQSPVDLGPLRFELVEPPAAKFSTSGGAFAMSPDGRHFPFVATESDGEDRIWLRNLGSLRSIPLPGTEGASQPFWSADSRMIAFYAGGFLRKVSLGGSAPEIISRIDGPQALSGSWNQSDVILLTVGSRGIFRVSAAGGTPARVPVPGFENCPGCLVWPQFLPDGRSFLFVVVGGPAPHGIYMGSREGRSARRLTRVVSSVCYVDPGYLIHAEAGALVARRLDMEHLTLSDDAVHVADAVAHNLGTGRAAFSASRTGVVVHREPTLSRLTWIDQQAPCSKPVLLARTIVSRSPPTDGALSPHSSPPAAPHNG